MPCKTQLSDRTKQPLVSVIVPSFNYRKTLSRCIKAIDNQTYKRLEIIIVDDNSTDGSFQLAQQLGAKVCRTAQNSGVGAARNLGVSKSSGDIVFFVDADVVLDSRAIETAVTIFQSSGEIVSVCGIYESEPLDRDSLWEEYRALQAYVWRKASVGDVSAGFFSIGGIRRRSWNVVGPFKVSLRQTEEIDYGERLSRTGRIVLSDRIRGHHDDDDRFFAMMRKFWRRSQDRVPFYFGRRKPMQGFELPRRLVSTALAPLVVLSLIVNLFLPQTVWVTASLVGLMILLERDIYIEAAKRLGMLKLPGLFFWYTCFHLSAALGILSGLFRFATSRSFRRLYAGEADYA